MAYRVTAALVVAKDQMGKNHHVYAGGVVPWLNDQQRDHFLRMNLVEEISDKQAKDEGLPSAPKKPAKTAPQEAWIDYGEALGHARGELEALSRQDLVDLLG